MNPEEALGEIALVAKKLFLLAGRRPAHGL